MDLEHRFTVPVGVEAAWAHFQDIGSVAECFPGATVTAVEGETFTGSVKVKLGPIALVYNGSGTFTERSEADHRFVVEAKGKDKRGNGTAGATVTLVMEGGGDSTDVTVHTDLSITGKPAQFGRGVMQDVSDKLLGQFVACLEQRLGQDAGPQDEGSQDAETGVTASAAEESAPPSATSGPAGSTGGDEAVAAAGAGAERPTPPSAAQPTSSASVSGSTATADALDLGRTVLPVLVKTYWKPAAVVLVALVVVIRVVRR